MGHGRIEVLWVLPAMKESGILHTYTNVLLRVLSITLFNTHVCSVKNKATILWEDMSGILQVILRIGFLCLYITVHKYLIHSENKPTSTSSQ